MGHFAFAIELYFAAMLGVSGLAKIDNPRNFATTLLQQRILPIWSITLASRTLPWIEIILAFLLVFGIGEPMTAILILALFVIFLGAKIFLLATGRTKDCGCYGSAKPQKVDGTSIVVSILLVLFAAVHFWLIIHIASVGWLWRLVAGGLLVGAAGFLAGRIIIRHHLHPSTPHIQASYAGGLDVGEQAPMFVAPDQSGNRLSLNNFQGQRRLLAFVLPGCSACPGALQALDRVLQDEPNLVGFVIGGPDGERNRAYAIEQNIRVPLLTPDADVVEKVYRVQGFPLVFVLDEVGVIRAKGVVNGYERMQELLKSDFAPLSLPH